MVCIKKMVRKKILLIDDELDFLKLIGLIIKRWQYDLITASSGGEGLVALREKKPDIIILDYMMPEMDGISTLKKIRDIDEKIPVIMFTAHPDIEVLESTGGLDVCGFIPKTADPYEGEGALKMAIEIAEKKLAIGEKE